MLVVEQSLNRMQEDKLTGISDDNYELDVQ